MLKLNLGNSKIFKSNRNIIICPSGLSFPFTISLIEKFKGSSTIITGSQEIFKVLVQLYPKLDIILFENPKSLTNKNFLKTIKNNYYNYKLKKNVKSFLIKYTNCKVFASIRAYSPLIAFSLIILSYKNKIYHKKLVKLFWKKTKPTLKIFLYKIYCKIFYRLDCDVLTDNNNIHLVYSKKYFRKICAQNMRYKINTNLTKKFCKKNLNIQSTQILLLSSGEALEHGTIDKKLYNDFIKKCSYTPYFKKMSLKRRNFEQKKPHVEKNLLEVPAQFPANILIYKYKVVIAFDSATLFESANNGCKAICLIDILSKDICYVRYVKDYLNGNLKKNKKILYPKTFEQFIKFCK